MSQSSICGEKRIQEFSGEQRDLILSKFFIIFVQVMEFTTKLTSPVIKHRAG
jgi:hypothetical protein